MRTSDWKTWMAGLMAGVVLGSVGAVAFGQSFTRHVIDPGMAGDVKAVGDLDGDGQLDLIVGGKKSNGEDLVWYRAPNWTAFTIATPNDEFTTDGAVGDVDGDGDLDIVVPDGPSGNNLVWFENMIDGTPTGPGDWARRVIGAIGNYGKDVEAKDFDGDGQLDVAVRGPGPSGVTIFFQEESGWSTVDLDVSSLGSEGMSSGDIDQDGRTDLVLRGAWVRNPGGSNARTASNWTEYSIGSVPSSFKAWIADLNGDNTMDVLFSNSESTGDVTWWTPIAGPTGAWTSAVIAGSVQAVHTLQAGDVDLDGDVDVVIAQSRNGVSMPRVWVYRNQGAAGGWDPLVVDEENIHNGILVDIGGDGDFDIFGVGYTGGPPVLLWENEVADEIPVELTAFSAKQDGDAVLLAWSTASETNNAGFEVQYRRQAADQFEGGGFVEGAGTTTSPQTYRYRIDRLAPGAYVFRLKQVDVDGTFAYSPEVELSITSSAAQTVSAAWPNPFQSATEFTVTVSQTQDVRIGVFDATGRQVARLHDGMLEAHRPHRFTFRAGALPSGKYWCRVRGPSFVEVRSVTHVQ